MKRLVWLVALIVLAASCTARAKDPSTWPPEQRVSPAPEFPAGLDWLNVAQPLTMDSLRGKIVVLDFWTYGCINCIHIFPDLEFLEEEFAEELVVIGVHSAKFDNESNTENIRQVVLRYGLQHPVVNDEGFDVWRAWGARAWPTVAVVDPLGNVVGTHAGEGVYEVLQPVIADLVVEFDDALDRTPMAARLESQGLPETVLSFPGKVLVDGDRLFISDTNHHRIVLADATSGDVVDVFGLGTAGFQDGVGVEAQFWSPQGLALSNDGGTLYVADVGNHAIRAIDVQSAAVATVAGTGEQGNYPPRGGSATETNLFSPWDLEMAGDVLLVAMAGSHQLWALDPEAGTIEPHTGSGREGTRNGPDSSAELAQPSGLTLGPSGTVFFADSESSSIRAVSTEGLVRLVAGGSANLFEFGDEDGSANEARFQHPLGIEFAAGGLWVADTYNDRIRRIDPITGSVETFLGSSSGWRDGFDPLFYEPGGLDSTDGTLFVADTNNHSIRRIDLSTGETSTIVLRGIEQFSNSDAVAIIDLDPVVVKQGDGEIVVSVLLPDGYKPNADASSSFKWSGAVADIPDLGPIAGPEFPLTIPVNWLPGSGTLTGEMAVVYCEADLASICLIEQFKVRVPVEVGTVGESSVEIEYTVTLPDLPSR